MAHDLPLSDVNILDLMWVMAGPMATRVLADYGATIVRVESTTRIDTVRTIGPYHDGDPGVENSGLYETINVGKFGMALDLSREAGREVVCDLVRWADVVTEAFSTKAMRNWGLDYDSLRQIKPDIIMLSTCLMGQDGPLAQFAGFGNLAAAISGFYNLTGWADRAPAGPFLAYTDAVSPRFTAASLLAALDHRRRTGQGQYIDQSQAEASLHFLAPALLDYTANGRVQDRMGNRDLHMAPHGVYPVLGEDRWVAIAVAGDAEWRAFCEVLQQPELAQNNRFATVQDRLAYQDDLDAIVSAWTRERDGQTVETALQARGVSACAVPNMCDMYEDPQLAHRGHFVELDHPIHGTTTVEGSRSHLSRTPARVNRAAPTLGQDTRYVLETILGYSAERIDELESQGILQ